jgi:hypothetical protein
MRALQLLALVATASAAYYERWPLDPQQEYERYCISEEKRTDGYVDIIESQSMWCVGLKQMAAAVYRSKLNSAIRTALMRLELSATSERNERWKFFIEEVGPVLVPEEPRLYTNASSRC